MRGVCVRAAATSAALFWCASRRLQSICHHPRASNRGAKRGRGFRVHYERNESANWPPCGLNLSLRIASSTIQLHPVGSAQELAAKMRSPARFCGGRARCEWRRGSYVRKGRYSDKAYRNSSRFPCAPEGALGLSNGRTRRRMTVSGRRDRLLTTETVWKLHLYC